MSKTAKAKTLDDIQLDMAKLYDRLETGNVDLKIADGLANIAGKDLKAKQLQLAREIFLSGRAPTLPSSGQAARLTQGD